MGKTFDETEWTGAPISENRRRSAGRDSGGAGPYVRVVKRRAAERRDRVGAGQRVDPPPVEEGRGRPDPLADDQAARRRRRRRARAGALRRARCRAAPRRRRRARAPRGLPGASAPSAALRGRARSRVSVKLELRKLRAGEVASLNGCVVVGGLVDRPMVGQGRHLAPRPLEAVVGVGASRASRRAKWNLPSAWAKPLRKCASSNGGWQSSQRAASSSASVAAAGSAQRPVDDLARAHGEAGVARADALGERDDHLVIGAAALRRLDRLGRRTADTDGRRRCRGRRARGTSSPAARCRRRARCR